MDDKQLMGFIEPTLKHYEKGKWIFPKDAGSAVLKSVKAIKPAKGKKELTLMETLQAINAAVEAAGKHG